MEIKKEIHQRKFRNEWQKGMVNLLYTYGWVTSRIKQQLKPFGITMQQFNVLRILNGSYPEPISTSIIRQRMLDKMSDASRIVERLHKKRLVIRKPCPTDRRLVDVVITEEGKQLILDIDKNAVQLDGIISKLTEEEARILNELLDKIRE